MARAGYGTSVRRMLRYNRVLSSANPRPELKTVDGLNGSGQANTVNLNTTGYVQGINFISSGSAFYNRVGRKIEMKSIHLVGVITQTGNATTVNDYCRVCIVYDRQTNGAAPSFSDIFSNYDQAGAITSGPFCGVNPDERERYLVLMDERLALPATGGTGGTDGLMTTYNINRYIKLRNLETHFKADSSPANIGDIATGAMYITGIGSLASGSQGYKFVGTWRIRYSDT
jgi:hypothetical protein